MNLNLIFVLYICVCMYIYICTYMYISFVYIYVCTYVCVCVYVCMYVCMYVCNLILFQMSFVTFIIFYLPFPFTNYTIGEMRSSPFVFVYRKRQAKLWSSYRNMTPFSFDCKHTIYTIHTIYIYIYIYGKIYSHTTHI